ncbi:MAG: pirin family protein, partial [Myxococcales bacterium]|nr:pirin family protein [Myxococcales bacterium]
MTAGRGIVHSEMPEPVEGRMRGFQLWVNLPAARKWDAPRYQDMQAGDVPTVDLGDATARVLAGKVGGVTGPVDGVVVKPTVLDVTVEERGELVLEVPAGHTAFVAGISGAPVIAGTQVAPGSLAILSDGEEVRATGAGRLLLVAGAPIGEPVARGGPFVMNTDEEIRQAWADYRSGRLVGG